jgi:hypothetical protein
MRDPDPRRDRPDGGPRPLHALVALLLAPWLAAGSCTIVAKSCTDTCDPCAEGCFCEDRPCTHPLDAGALALDAAPVGVELRGDGSLVQTIGPIVGLSAAATSRGRAFERADLVRYADALVRSNPELFGAPRGWDVLPLEPLRDGHLVLLERADALATFGFDRAGAVTWIEIQRAASAESGER